MSTSSGTIETLITIEMCNYGNKTCVRRLFKGRRDNGNSESIRSVIRININVILKQLSDSLLS